MYKIVIKRSALEELEGIQKNFRLKLIQKIDELALDPRPSGVRKLESNDNNYRVRVGDYRIIYQIVDALLIIDVIKIANRKEAYRNK